MAQFYSLWALYKRRIALHLLLIGGLVCILSFSNGLHVAAQEADPCAGTSPSKTSAKTAGYITVNSVPAAVGTTVTMHNTVGDRVGCRVTDTEGLYGWTYVNGYSGVDEPYMQVGEEVQFRVNGYEATASPVFYWADDAYVQVDLSVVIPLVEITGSYTFEGRTDHSSVLHVNFYEVGAATPIYSFTPTGTSSGEFTVSGMSPGAYEIAVKYSNTLQAVETVTLVEGVNNIDFGALPAGDANDDNVVSTADVSILASSFGRSEGQSGYDARADFNADGLVSTADVSLLANNFNRAGE